MGNCVDCALRISGSGFRDWGHCNGPNCSAVLDGIHPLGWGYEEPDGKVRRNEKGLILVSGCYYYQPMENRWKCLREENRWRKQNCHIKRDASN